MSEIKYPTVKVAYYWSPGGEMIIGSYGERICLCDWVNNRRRGVIDGRICGYLSSVYEDGHSDVLGQAVVQLEEYFSGTRREFSIPILYLGTEFQCKVWRELVKIPYGTTVSYGELARSVQSPKAVRAVATAVANNPISILVPCHRVIGSDGKITGYAGGLKAKRLLLDLERKDLSL